MSSTGAVRVLYTICIRIHVYRGVRKTIRRRALCLNAVMGTKGYLCIREACIVAEMTRQYVW